MSAMIGDLFDRPGNIALLSERETADCDPISMILLTEGRDNNSSSILVPKFFTTWQNE